MSKEETVSSIYSPGIPLSPQCLALGKVVHFKKKQVIFEMGTVPEKLYYILSGTVRVVSFSEDSERLVVFTVPEKAFVCDVRFLAELPLSFQVESLTDITMIAFSRETVVQLLGSDATFRQSLFLGIAKKMRKFGSDMLRTAYNDTQTRLLDLLNAAATRKNGISTVTMSQQELAEHLGVHRVTVNRILRKLQSQGRLTVEREHITLH